MQGKRDKIDRAELERTSRQSIQTATAISSRSDELRLWLILSAALDLSFLVTLTNSERPLSVIGVMFFIHLLVLLPTAFSFHRVAVLEAVMKVENDGGVESYEPPCGGLFGSGGTTPAFICYIGFAGLQTYRLNAIYTTCALSSYRLKLDAASHFHIIFAFILILCSLVFVEIGRRAKTSQHLMYNA